MWLDNLWRNRSKQTPAQRQRVRPTLECLELRDHPASFTATTVGELIGAINTANLSAEADTITLAPGATFTLKQAYGLSHHAMTGLPPITAAGGPLTIVGNGDIIERSTTRKTPAFRLVTVETGANLTLENLTLQGGLVATVGGGIYNAGTLTLNGVTVQRNTVKAEIGSLFAYGGGIYSLGQLTLAGCVVQDNQVIGGDGHNGRWVRDPRGDDRGRHYEPPTAGGSAVGGGVHVAAGTAHLLATTVVNNTATGGRGGSGGGFNAADGFSSGGGIHISPSASVTLDAFTVAHTVSNSAKYDPNIDGNYSIS
jgi:hypothetical protein